jgi:transcriptional regulator with XRE-family HTH domain
MLLQKIFGSNVRHHRRAQGLTLEQLAEAVGVSRETIGKIERGTSAPLFETAERIATALDVSPLSLFTGFAEPMGERGRLLASIHDLLSDLNDEQLSKLSKIIEAFAGK